MRWCKINYKLEQMKNTIENKARFFGNHLTSKIMCMIDGEVNYGYLTGLSLDTEQAEVQLINNHHAEEEPTMVSLDDCKLCFTPLSSISDVDAIEQALFAKKIEIDVNDTKKLCELGKWRSIDCLEQLPYQEIDFLRSKGYALLFHNLSVSDLENYGWIKLIK